MRRKSGLKMIDAARHATASLKSEYRGPSVEDDYMWTYHPSSRDLPPEHIFGVFTLERTIPDGLRILLKVMAEYGLTLEYSPLEFDQNIQVFTKQLTTDAKEIQ